MANINIMALFWNRTMILKRVLATPYTTLVVLGDAYRLGGWIGFVYPTVGGAIIMCIHDLLGNRQSSNLEEGISGWGGGIRLRK